MTRRALVRQAIWHILFVLAVLFLQVHQPRLLSADQSVAGMTYIPAGEFLMGTPAGMGGFSDERPQRKILLPAFWIDTYEVSNQAYFTFVTATGHRPPTHDQPALTLWEHGMPPAEANEHPVVNVSWHDAAACCRWAGKRLPTEAEWEKAARGVDGRTYPWGNRWDFSLANGASYWAKRTVDFKDGTEWRNFWMSGDGARAVERYGIKQEVLTLPLGSFPEGVSPYGVADMAGNVSEWVADFYNPYYYVNGTLTDPQGPAPTILRSVRGGSWLKPATSLRAADRDYGDLHARMSGVGFRCAKDDR